ncbi:hypothetical protein [Streptomyces sp. NPDC051636]|uniref:hypothetical protein n=1 Tax=Streptomyces sp. NPDC051636 TaxID=3365663 RepID=UPI003799C8B4
MPPRRGHHVLTNRRKDPDHEAVRAEVLRCSEKLEEARRSLDTRVVTYEELTAEPERTARGVCGFLGVEWESSVLDYGSKDHGTFRPQLGDWSSTLRPGRIRTARTAGRTAAAARGDRAGVGVPGRAPPR